VLAVEMVCERILLERLIDARSLRSKMDGSAIGCSNSLYSTLGCCALKWIDRRIKVDRSGLVCSNSSVWICLVAAEAGMSGFRSW
jgi:hypothetical protein